MTATPARANAATPLTDPTPMVDVTGSALRPRYASGPNVAAVHTPRRA
ncbi:hypothetical protein KBX50_27955 [Micromonospora sp. C51]|nr:hypothetical protein [Micromonospora sp. C51]MBQ1052276.1 hypothetical protein [Micromonospora sp. C51]